MLIPLCLILLGIVLLVAGGETLLRGAVGLATLLKLTPAVIGLTVVAAGTSVPELAVSGVAAMRGSVEIAVANVIGSSILNMTIILGICALIRPFQIVGNTIQLEYPVLVLVTLLMVHFVHDGTINRFDAVLFLSIYVGFTMYLVRLVRGQVTAAEAKSFKEEVQELTPAEHRPKAWFCFVLVAIGVTLLTLGANSTVSGAVRLARQLGISESMIGLTIVSAGTVLPEVVASVVSSLRGRSDIAVGNVIGSNLFNILCILGINGLISPLPVQPELLASDRWWLLGITLLLFPIMFSGKRVSRGEGALLIAVYGLYLALLLRG